MALAYGTVANTAETNSRLLRAGRRLQSLHHRFTHRQELHSPSEFARFILREINPSPRDMAWVGTATILVGSAGVAAGILYNCASDGAGYLWSSWDDSSATRTTATLQKPLPIAAEARGKVSVDPVALHQAGIDLTTRNKTVLVYFRGTWSPPCRSQLRDISKAMGEFEQNGIAIHAITAVSTSWMMPKPDAN